TTNDATRVAAVGGFSATCFHCFSHSLAADVIGPLVPSAAEIFSGKSAGFVQDINQNVGAVSAQTLTDRMSYKGIGKSLGSTFESLRIGNGHAGSVGVVYHDGFYLLGTHYGAEAATSGAADVALTISKRNIGCRKPHFSRGADDCYANFVAVLFLQHFDGFVVSHAQGFRGSILDGHDICCNLDDKIFVFFCGNPLKHKRLDARSGHLLTK